MDQTPNAMDTDSAAARTPPIHGQTLDALESVRTLLALARHLVNEGNPSLALQAVMAAMRSHGGEHAMFQTLQRARELYRNKLQANAAADELASLFAECAIVEAQPLNPHAQPPPLPTQSLDNGIPHQLLNAANETSILASSGRKQVMLDAFSDGSSFICLQCGGLVSNLRKDEHITYWCGKN